MEATTLLSAGIAALAAVVGVLWKIIVQKDREQAARIRELEAEKALMTRQWKDAVIQHSVDARRFLTALENLRSRSCPPSGPTTRT